MTKKPNQPSFNAKEAIVQAERDFAEAVEAEDILDAVSRGVWIKDHQTEPPETAIATPLAISLWYSEFGDNEKEDFIRAFAQNDDIATAWAKRWTEKEMVLEWPVFAQVLLLALSEPPTLRDKKPGNSIDVEGVIKYLRTIGTDMAEEADKPLSRIVRAWQNRPRTIETASTTQTSGVVRIPYRASEVLRRDWKPLDGDVNAVIVDGEPLAAWLKDITPPARGKKARVYSPNKQGQMTLAISIEGKSKAKPVPLIAFEQFSDDLRSPIATDVAILMTVAHASNQDIRLTSAEGARFLARGLGGQARRVREPDKQRFEDAFAALHGMSQWVHCPDGICRLYPLIKTDRINDDLVEFGPPTWAKNQSGFYTLSGAFGQASAGRLVGQANDGGLWRTIYGVEYWLARAPATWSQKRKKMVGSAKTLLPASGKAGPGQWEKIKWRQLLILSGECWDPADKREDAKARQRYKRRIERLQGYGTEKTKSGKRVKKKIYPSYFTPSPGSAPAEAGDTVEFHQSKRGYINVRATERFVAGAELASKSQFEIMRLAEFMGI